MDADNRHIFQPVLDEDFRARCEACETELEACSDCQRRQAEYKEKEETTLWVYDTSVREYHDGEHNRFKNLKYREQHEKPLLYYGMEIELVFNTDERVGEIAKDFIKATNGMFVAEFDRSVTNTGIGCEFISRPMSFKKWASPEVENLLKQGFEAIAKYNPLNPQPDTCGIHVHMSRVFFSKNTLLI